MESVVFFAGVESLEDWYFVITTRSPFVLFDDRQRHGRRDVLGIGSVGKKDAIGKDARKQ